MNEMQHAKDEFKLLGSNIDIVEFLKYIQNSSHLLSERKAGEYEFSHHTFQEYLTSIYISDNNKINYLLGKLNEDFWHETIILYSAKNEATAILESCIDILEQNVTDTFLKFALKITEEGIINSQTIAKFDNLLDKLMDSKTINTINIISNVLLNKKLNNMKTGTYP